MKLLRSIRDILPVAMLLLLFIISAIVILVSDIICLGCMSLIDLVHVYVWSIIFYTAMVPVLSKIFRRGRMLYCDRKKERRAG